MGFAAGGSFVSAASEPIHQPAQATANQAAAEKPIHSQPDEGIWDWITHDAVGFFTLWLVIIAGGQLILFLWQLVLIRESLDDAKIAAEAAKELADAAKEGASATRDNVNVARLAMTASDRAYVHHNGFRWISHRNLATGNVFWRIRPRWINSGNTPTRRGNVAVYYELRDAELPPDFLFIQPPTVNYPAVIGPKEIIESAHNDVDGFDLVAIRNGKKFFYIWGIATYRDVFPDTPPRITKFCVFVDAVMGDPLSEWDEKTNNVELKFATYHRHNCADEDCGDQP